MIKTRLRSLLFDCVAQLMRISIEGPEIDAEEFEEVLEICKEHNHRILLWCLLSMKKIKILALFPNEMANIWEWGGGT